MKLENLTKEQLITEIKGLQIAMQLIKSNYKNKVFGIINELERENWDCPSKHCGLVNNDCDKCKECGTDKSKSYDNDKLEMLKDLLGKEDKS